MARVIETHTKVMAVAPGKIWVVAPQQGCAACQKQCGLSTFNETRSQWIPIDCDEPVSVGKEVTLTITEQEFLHAALSAYLLPATCTVMGAGFATLLENTDRSAILGAFLGLVLGLLFTHFFGYRTQVPKISIFSEDHT